MDGGHNETMWRMVGSTVFGRSYDMGLTTFKPIMVDGSVML